MKIILNDKQSKLLNELIDLMPILETIETAYKNKEIYSKYDIENIVSMFHKNFYDIDVLIDINYQDNLNIIYEKYKERLMENVFELSIEEANTIFTKIIRGEKFIDGHIATNIYNGNLLKLMKYYKIYFQL